MSVRPTVLRPAPDCPGASDFREALLELREKPETLPRLAMLWRNGTSHIEASAGIAPEHALVASTLAPELVRFLLLRRAVRALASRTALQALPGFWRRILLLSPPRLDGLLTGVGERAWIAAHQLVHQQPARSALRYTPRPMPSRPSSAVSRGVEVLALSNDALVMLHASVLAQLQSHPATRTGRAGSRAPTYETAAGMCVLAAAWARLDKNSRRHATRIGRTRIGDQLELLALRLERWPLADILIAEDGIAEELQVLCQPPDASSNAAGAGE